MLHAPPYLINPLSIEKRFGKQDTQRRRENATSAPLERPTQKGGSYPHRKAGRPTRSDYSQRGSIERSHLRDIESAERRAFNQKVDTLIQKRNDKTSLENWRLKSKRLQAQTQRSRGKKHELKLPFGNELQQDNARISKHAEDVQEVLSKDKVARLRQLRDQQLEERIQEHAKHIREWRQKDKLDKMENDLKTAKENLEKALNLQRDLEEKRALQYRLRAFTAEDFSPQLHNELK